MVDADDAHQRTPSDNGQLQNSSGLRSHMASPAPVNVDAIGVTDEEFNSLKKFDWTHVRPEILSDLEFIINLPPSPTLDYAALGDLLPPKDKTDPVKTLFIDLDETLAHTSICDSWSYMAPCDLTFESEADGSEVARVYFRPWVTDFLRVTACYYEIVLYTASVQLYADMIVDRLDVEKRIKHRLYREHCTQYGNSEIYFKDLHGTGRRLEDSVVIDNRLISFGLNVENGIFVSSFTGQYGDTELLHLIPLLIALSEQKDVRECLVKTYKLPEILRQYKLRNSKSVDSKMSSHLMNSIGAFGNVNAHQLAGDQKLTKHMAAAQMIAQDTGGTSRYEDEWYGGDSSDEIENLEIKQPGMVTPSGIECVEDDEIVDEACRQDGKMMATPVTCAPEEDEEDTEVMNYGGSMKYGGSIIDPQSGSSSKENTSKDPSLRESQVSGSRHLNALAEMCPAYPTVPKEVQMTDEEDTNPPTSVMTLPSKPATPPKEGSMRRLNCSDLSTPSRRRKFRNLGSSALKQSLMMINPQVAPSRQSHPSAAQSPRIPPTPRFSPLARKTLRPYARDGGGPISTIHSMAFS